LGRLRACRRWTGHKGISNKFVARQNIICIPDTVNHRSDSADFKTMRRFADRYETEVRLGLVAIVVLLLILNLGSSYILQSVQARLTGQIDERLTGALAMAGHYLGKNQVDRMAEDQARLFRQQFGLVGISVGSLDPAAPGGIRFAESPNGLAPDDLGGFSAQDSRRLQQGRFLFRTGQNRGIRYGLAAPKSIEGRGLVIAAVADAQPLAALSRASRMVFYLAIGMSLLVIPLALFLPRLILRPFRTMKETARSVGRLSEAAGDDDVAAVTASYQAIIEELKQNELELRRLYTETSSRADRLETMHQYLLQSINAGVMMVDPAGKVIGFNRAAGEILGYDPADVVGRHYLAGLPEEESLGLLIEAGLLRDETFGTHDLEVVRGGRPSLWLTVGSSLVRDDTGQGIGVAVLFADQTELKQLQAELEINRRMAALGEMTGGLAHQLRNSLAAMSGFSQLLTKKASSDPVLSDLAESIRSEAAVSAAMVERFLNFAKPLTLNTESLDPVTLVEGCLRKIGDRAERDRIAIRFRRPDIPFRLDGDALLLREAVGNVLDNALQAAGPEGLVDIALEAGADGLQLVIADSGPGIADDIRDRLFTPFFSSKPSGTGLGLALARKIINLHGGSITFDKRREPGAVCRITLPMAATVCPAVSSSSVAVAKKS